MSALTDAISRILDVERKRALAQSQQLTLGELIEKLETLKRLDVIADDAVVLFDFVNTFPTGFDSWRGSYSELALNYCTWDSEFMPRGLDAFLKLCKDAIGKIFTGYKGGSFTMHKDTPIWVANLSESGSTGVIDVRMFDGNVILVTGVVPLSVL